MFAHTSIVSRSLAGILTKLLRGLLFSFERCTTPRYSGHMKFSDLLDRVDIVRDQWGIPHIYAQNEEDLFFAQGYVHAQDRLWQMELQRRVGRGQLAEIFGKRVLNTDRFLRTLGLHRVVEQEAKELDEETRHLLISYLRGVNAYLQQNRRRLPLEFLLLRFRPRVWTIQDVLILGKVLALDLSGNWLTEILRVCIIATVGKERAQELEPGKTQDHLPAFPSTYYEPARAGTIQQETPSFPLLKSSEFGPGSNCWAVGGERSSTGKPLLANDMHLQIQMPSLWYENHLVGGDFQVTGASIPGAPGVVVGHNAAISWGITNGMADVQDLYIERFDPENSTNYKHCDQWKQATIVREPILVRGQRLPYIEEVMLTRHGPVITPFLSQELQQPEERKFLALQWTALRPGNVSRAVLALNRAKDWETFRQAIAWWKSPALNFVYADQQGHIGYSFAGDIPIRENADGRVPVEGWDDTFEWKGYVSAAELPHRFDPPEQIIATANNKPVDETYCYPLYGEWDTGYRIRRIIDLLESSEKHDMTSFKQMQGDSFSIPGSALAKLAEHLPTPTPLAQAALASFASWDCLLLPESVGATIYACFCAELLAIAYEEVKEPLKTTIAHRYMPGMAYLRKALPDILQRLAQQEDDWLVDRSWSQVLSKAWLSTLRILQDKYGDDVTQWHYKGQHTLLMRHVLGGTPIIGALFNRGPFPIGGDINTIHMSLGAPAYFAPTYRQICDTADWENCVSMHSSGQSGRPGNPHYDDFISPWLAVDYHPMLWSKQRIDQAAQHRLVLAPSGENFEGTRSEYDPLQKPKDV